VKMSEILLDFVEPFAEGISDNDAFCRLLTLGVLAWNAALKPEPQCQNIVDRVIARCMRGESTELQAAYKEIVRDLVLRKRSHFAQYRRPILQFHVEDTEDGFHLTVMSLLN